MLAPCHSGVYVASIARLVAHLQLPMPHYAIAADGASTPGAVELPSRTSTMFLFDEHSPEWKHFLMDLAPAKRHHAASMRRATTEVYFAIRHETCLYCWLPCPNCMCTVLWQQRQRVAAAAACSGTASSVTLILHVNELLRTTNTGHIAAFVMDGPVRVWGIDDDWLGQLGAPAVVCAPDGTTRLRHDLLLYPENDCLLLPAYIQQHALGAETATPSQGEVTAPSSAEKATPTAAAAAAEAVSTLQSPDVPAASQEPVSTVAPAVQLHEMHYMLSDGTWGQAHRVNRHVPRAVPRVALTIAKDYESLFAALRRQTRATGVSTLEAIMLALDAQCTAMGQGDADRSGTSAVVSIITDTMKRFVDTVLVLKNYATVFADTHNDEAFLTETEGKRNRNLVFRQQEERAAREAKLGVVAVQGLMAPPVLSYCYHCDCYIGWSRMPEHVTGVKHREVLALNPTGGLPSETSLDIFCDYILLRVLPRLRPPA